MKTLWITVAAVALLAALVFGFAKRSTLADERLPQPAGEFVHAPVAQPAKPANTPSAISQTTQSPHRFDTQPPNATPAPTVRGSNPPTANFASSQVSYPSPAAPPSVRSQAVRVMIAQDGNVDMEIPPQASVPAILFQPSAAAQSANSSPVSTTSPPPAVGSFASAVPLSSSPAFTAPRESSSATSETPANQAAGERIADEFVKNVKPATPGSETSLEQWEDASYVADEKFRSFYGTDAFMQRSLQAAKASFASAAAKP